MLHKKIPSHQTVWRWIAQVGYYKLVKAKERAEDWVFLVDFSIQIGTQKCLMIIGTKLSKLKWEKALQLSDLEPISLELHEQCNANTVKQALERAAKKVGTISAICADEGSDVAAGIKRYRIDHESTRYIPDIVHKLALCLKHRLEDNPRWIKFSTLASETKKKLQQTQWAHLASPNQRSKSRFLNLETLVNWAVATLEYLDREKTAPSCDQQMLQKHLGWLEGFRSEIVSYRGMLRVAEVARHVVRTEGIHAQVGKVVDDLLMADKSLDRHACEMAGEVIDFLEEQALKVTGEERLVGSSECLESLFGKLKNLEDDQSHNGFTSLVLAMAACVGKIDVAEIRQALKETKAKDVSDWQEKNIGKTVQSKRRKTLRLHLKRDINQQHIQEVSSAVDVGLELSGISEGCLEAM